MQEQRSSHAADEAAFSGDSVDIETALTQVGVGPFHWMALLVCGLANAADAVEILGMSLVLPAAEGDPAFDLTPGGKSALSSCIFLGMLLGGVLWGPMGDVLGRRRSLLVALLINAFFGVMSAGARSVGALVAMRLLGGVGVGGSVPVVFSFLAELLPAHARGRYMVLLAAHWMVGSIFSAGMGWAIIPASPDAWRTFLAVASLPAWCAAVGTWFMPESPRFLLVQGYTEAAEQVLLRMSAINKNSRTRTIRLLPHKSHHLPLAPAAGSINGSSSSSNSDHDRDSMAWQHAQHGHVSQHQSNPVVDHHQSNLGEAGTRVHRLRPSSASSSQPVGLQPAAAAAAAAAGGGSARRRGSSQQGQQPDWKQQQRQCCRSSFNTAKLLLQQPLRRRFLPLLVAWLGLCGGWYSTVLWIPEYFKARGAHSASLYAETFAVAAANLPGNIASIFMVDLLGRRLTACICLAGACGAALLFAFAPADPVWSVAAACIFNGISVGGWNALDLLSAELFATEVRSTAMGLLGAFGRLASFTTTFMAGALMQWLLWSPLLVAAALLAAGSIAIMLLPEMAHRPLEDTLEDAADSEVVVTALTGQSSQTARAVRGPGSGSGGRVSGWGGSSSRVSGQQGFKQQLRGSTELEMAPALGAAGAAAAAAARFSLSDGQEGAGGNSSSTGLAANGLQPGSSEEELKAEERLGLLRAGPANF